MVLFLYFILVTKHSSVLGLLGRLIELDLDPHLQGFALCILLPFLPLLKKGLWQPLARQLFRMNAKLY